jgi:hypothetical protein
MKYMVTFALTTVGYKERIARFLETGAPPPEAVTMHGRWFTLGHDRGFMIAETDEPAAIYEWVSWWGDLIDFEVHPVIGDEEVAAVLSRL